MNYYSSGFWAPSDYLMHHGILGQKWGVRRYQNADGTLTAAGKRRYGSEDAYNKRQALKEANRAYNKAFNKAYSKNYQIYSLNKKKREAKEKQWDEVYDKAAEWRNARKAYKEAKSEAKINAKLDKFESKVSKYNSKIDTGREKNRAKLINKGARIETVNDFDAGTKAIKAGQDKIKNIITNYRDMQIKAIKDRSIRKDPEFKRAVARFNEISGNLPMATLGYAMESAAEESKKSKS